MRLTWVKTLKELFQDIEKRQPYKLVYEEKKFLEKFNLIANAWAESDSRYNCFYGGWPSIKKGKYCQNPSRVNTSYEKNACKQNELQCQPLLFGKGLCAPGATQTDRNSSFSNCEKKFQQENKGNYDFLKNLDQQDAQDLHELSVVAAKVCQENKSGQTSICKKIMSKLGDGLKSIQRGLQQVEASARTTVLTASPKMRNPASSPHNPDCPEEEHSHGLNLNNVQSIQKAANFSGDQLYQQLKENFQNSPFCNPHAIVSDPVAKPSPVISSRLYSDLGFIDFANIGNDAREKLTGFKAKYGFSESVTSEVTPILDEIARLPHADERSQTLKLRAKSLLLQDYLKNYKYDPEFMKDEIKEELVKHNIFKRNENGEAECPFVTKDAFLKALAGRDEVLKAHGGSLKNKKQMTIVDYTRPSNERRMFVIDLENMSVLHNTWVAHGSGGGSGSGGADGLGGSPNMSNQLGSNMSSDGFIIASAASHGKLFGPNVILKGIDKNNTNLQRRAVIIHKWDSPYQEYSVGAQDYNDRTESYGPRYDINEKIKKSDFRSAGKQEMKDSLSALSSSLYVFKTMFPTQGCLGVPQNNIRHLDQKRRNLSQLEALRQDLPGSLIFNYSGPDMSSKYF